MKITPAQIQPRRQEVAATLAAGGTVSIATAPDALHNLPGLNGSLSLMELASRFKASDLATQPVLRVSPAVQRSLATLPVSDSNKMLIGVGTGTVVGLGAGLLLDALRQVAPMTGTLAAIGCALIGAGAGGAIAGNVLSVDYDIKGGTVTLKPAG